MRCSRNSSRGNSPANRSPRTARRQDACSSAAYWRIVSAGEKGGRISRSASRQATVLAPRASRWPIANVKESAPLPPLGSTTASYVSDAAGGCSSRAGDHASSIASLLDETSTTTAQLPTDLAAAAAGPPSANVGLDRALIERRVQIERGRLDEHDVAVWLIVVLQPCGPEHAPPACTRRGDHGQQRSKAPGRARDGPRATVRRRGSRGRPWAGRPPLLAAPPPSDHLDDDAV